MVVTVATNNSVQTLFLYVGDGSRDAQKGDTESQTESVLRKSGFIKSFMFQSTHTLSLPRVRT